MDTAEVHRPKRCNKENERKDTGLTESITYLINSNACLYLYINILFNGGLKKESFDLIGRSLYCEQGK